MAIIQRLSSAYLRSVLIPAEQHGPALDAFAGPGELGHIEIK